MQRLIPSAVLILAVSFAVPAAHAQEASQPGVVVLSQNKCGMDKVDDVAALSEEIFSPILDQKVSDGELYGYGYLSHAWGDEWNFVIYYLAPSVASFSETFNEIGQQLGEEHPDFMERLAEHCSEHKDSIYSVVKMVGPESAD